jgi:hypothetical protein
MKAILFIAVLFFVRNSFAQTLDSLSTNQPSLISNADTVNKKIFICTPSHKSFGNEPLLIIDGKERDTNYIKNLDPKMIVSVNVLKRDEAVKKYRKKAENGVIIIRTKIDPILQ